MFRRGQPLLLGFCLLACFPHAGAAQNSSAGSPEVWNDDLDRAARGFWWAADDLKPKLKELNGLAAQYHGFLGFRKARP